MGIYILQFNSEQLKAISHGEGPALVIAGPGSGKTAVLTHRIKYLIEENNISPENILVITFSKAASMEMQNRFIKICGEEFYPVNFGTFHSIFFQILSNVENYNVNSILKLKEKRELMSRAIFNARILDNPEKELIDELLSDVSFYKNSDETGKIDSVTNITEEQFLKIYREYCELQKSYNKIDFEDMLLNVKRIFQQNSQILARYQNMYKYILVDEYQDINSIQYEIIRLLAGKTANLWVCGDIGTYLIYRRTIRVHCNMA